MELTDRLPPSNPDAERAVLGSLLLDGDWIYRVSASLSAGDFYREDHAVIYRAMLHLYETGMNIDFLTVSNALEMEQALDQVGGTAYLVQLLNEAPTSAHAVHYAKIVHELAQKRKLITLAGKMATMGYEGNANADILARQVLQEFGEIIATAQKATIYSLPQLLELPMLNYAIGEGVLPLGGRMVLYGPRKGGKTRLLIELALALATGKPWLGRFPVDRPCRVLFVERDMPLAGFKDWLKLAMDGLGVAPHDCPLLVSDGWGINLATPEGVMQLAQLADQAQAEVLILDCLRRLHSAQENDSTEMEAVYGGIDTVRIRNDLAGLAIAHHTRKLHPNAKLTPEDARGTGGLLDWVDSAIGLDGREGKTDAKLTMLLRFGEVEDLALSFDWDTFQWAAQTINEATALPLKMAEIIIKTAQGKIARKAYLEQMGANGISQKTARTTLDNLLKDGIVEMEPSRKYDSAAHGKARHIVLKKTSFYVPSADRKTADDIPF